MLNNKICKLLASAQIASDAGKGIYDMPNYVNAIENYSGKDTYILTAIKTCIKKKNTGFNFYVTYGDTTPYLVYFSFMYKKEKYQISFHSFDPRLNEYKSPSKHTEVWDENSSRNTAILLQNIFTQNKGGDYMSVE